MRTLLRRRWAPACVLAAFVVLAPALVARQSPQPVLPASAPTNHQSPQAILLNPATVNGSVTGSSWWLANQSLTVTWDTATGLRLSSVYDRIGGRSGTKPGEAFTISLRDGRVIKSSECRPSGTRALVIVKPEGQAAVPGAARGHGLAIETTFACPDDAHGVHWRAELLDGAHTVRQTAAMVVSGFGTVSLPDVVGFAGSDSTPAAAVAASGVAILAGPCLQEPGPTGMTVTWVADAPSAGWVEYGQTDGLGTVALPVEDGLVTAGGKIHMVRLNGLRADSTYHYRIVTRRIVSFGPYKVDYGDTVRSEAFTFRTLAPAGRTFSFLVLNDLHEGLDVMRAQIRQAAAQPYDLVFFNGDSLSHIESPAQIVERLLAPATQAFARSVPMLFVRGNHETRGQSARDLRNYLALPGGRYFYSFDHGPVHFVVLDTGEDKEDEHWAYSGLADFAAYRKAERAWLQQEVATTAFRNARFRVLVAHMPFFGGARTRVSGVGPTQCREMFGDILNDAALDLHIAGHTHRADWVEVGSGGNLFPIVVGGGNQAGSNTLTRVNVSADALEITQTTDDGKVVGTHVVTARR